jgi:hypothetical protein
VNTRKRIGIGTAALTMALGGSLSALAPAASATATHHLWGPATVTANYFGNHNDWWYSRPFKNPYHHLRVWTKCGSGNALRVEVRQVSHNRLIYGKTRLCNGKAAHTRGIATKGQPVRVYLHVEQVRPVSVSARGY